MDADDVMEQENEQSPKKKTVQPSGIALEALTGLLDSYTPGEMKVTFNLHHVRHDNILVC